MSVVYQRWEIGGGPGGGGGGGGGYNNKMGQRHEYESSSDAAASSTCRWQQQQPPLHEQLLAAEAGRSTTTLCSSFSVQSQRPESVKAFTTTTTVSRHKGFIVRFDDASSNTQISAASSHHMSVNVEAALAPPPLSAAKHPVVSSSPVSLLRSEHETLDSALDTILPPTHQLEAMEPMEQHMETVSTRSGGIARMLECQSILSSMPNARLDTPLHYRHISLASQGTDRMPRTIKQPAPESLLSSEPPSLSSMEEIAHESSSSSSIGDELDEDSSCSSDVDTQSKGPLDQMSSLENSLPIKKPGLSKFFGGKSKSFSSLADAKSISDLAKPENPYARRRKMGYNCHLDRHRSYPPLSRSSVTGISKKSVNGSRITLAVALKLGGIDEDDKEEATSHPASSRSSLNTLFPSRSFSLTDLPVAGSPSPPLRRTIGQL